jgi:hypothetical protein
MKLFLWFLLLLEFVTAKVSRRQRRKPNAGTAKDQLRQAIRKDNPHITKGALAQTVKDIMQTKQNIAAAPRIPSQRTNQVGGTASYVRGRTQNGKPVVAEGFSASIRPKGTYDAPNALTRTNPHAVAKCNSLGGCAENEAYGRYIEKGGDPSKIAATGAVTRKDSGRNRPRGAVVPKKHITYHAYSRCDTCQQFPALKNPTTDGKHVHQLKLHNTRRRNNSKNKSHLNQ